MIKLTLAAAAALALCGCSAITGAPRLSVTAERSGCSEVVRAMMPDQLTAAQILAGVEACEKRDRAGAMTVDPAELRGVRRLIP